MPGTQSYAVQVIDNQSNNVVSNANLANDDFLVWEQANLMPDSEYTITVTSLQHVKKLENTVMLRTLKVPSMPELGIRDVRSTTVQLFWTRALESTTGHPPVNYFVFEGAIYLHEGDYESALRTYFFK